MPAAAEFLAFDLGASSGRAVVGSFDGQRLTLEEVHRFANGPVTRDGHLRWDLDALLEQIRTGLGRCRDRGARLEGIGIDTWGVDYGLLGPDGSLLGLPFHYRDSRNEGMMEAAFARVPRDELYARTGIQFLPFNTLFQLLADQARHPARLEAAETLLFMPDLLNYQLTGVRRSEHSIASTSQAYDAATGQWDMKLLERLDLPVRILPEVAPSGSVVGPLRKELADAAGLGHVPVIAPACHDTGSAVAAVPAEGERWAYISSGTWSLLGAELAAPIRTPQALAYSFTNEGGVGGTVRFLTNVAGLWLVQECRRTWAEQGDDRSFAELAALAEAASPGKAFVDPDDPRFAAPGDMPGRIQAYCRETGQPVPRSSGEIVRCALESLALKYRVCLERLETLIGESVDVLHVVGGGVRNTLLCRLTADTTGKPVIAGPAEATAAGNVMVQALARGRVRSLAEIRAVLRQSSSLERYDPAATAEWDEAYERFVGLLG
jgi:rhamnulokinase